MSQPNDRVRPSGDSPGHVVLAGGGTAGHVEPALAVADALRRRHPDVGITFVGTRGGLEERLVPARGHDLRLIPRVPLPRRPSADLVSLPVRLAGAVRDVRRLLDEVGADVVVGFGGYVALPAYLAARGRVPVIVHEANARPGLANRIGARWAAVVAETVPGSLPGARCTGVPVRQQVAAVRRSEQHADACEHFGLRPDAPVLLVMGGSQGARRINEAVTAAAADLARAGVQVLHAVGPANEHVISAVQSATHVALPYLERMDLAYAAADVALCRSGAMTCAELSAVGLPSVLVPYAVGNGEQALNAAPLVQAGGALMVRDADLTAQVIRDTVLPLLLDRERIDAMSAALADRGTARADESMAYLVDEVAGWGRT